MKLYFLNTSKNLALSLVFMLAGFHSHFALANGESVRPTVVLGSGVVFERNNDNLTQSTRLPLSFGAGARMREWSARIEYLSFRTSDGNQTLSVRREAESALLWGAYDLREGAALGWTPYVALGVGAGKTSVETRGALGNEKNVGDWRGIFAASAGMRGAWSERLAVRPEVRYESAEAFKTKDARWGVFVQLEILL